MAKDVTVDKKQLIKDIKYAQNKLDVIAADAMRKTMANKKQVFMTFDDVEAIPYAALATGRITLSGTFESGDMTLEAMLRRETRSAIDNASVELNKGLRGVFKL